MVKKLFYLIVLLGFSLQAYCNQADSVPAQSQANASEFLNFTAVNGPATVRFELRNIHLQYSVDNCITWIEYTSGVDIQLANGSKVYFRAPKRGSYMGTSISATMSGTIAADGNIMSLLDTTMQTTTIPGTCFAGMFQGCTSLIQAPALPATTLSNSCYKYMFRGCTSLTHAPALPATTLADECYFNMFEGCTSLTQIPVLPAKILRESCCAGMFSNCSSLQVNVNPPGVEWCMVAYKGAGAEYPLSYMFYGTGGTMCGTPDINTIYYIASSGYTINVSSNDDQMGTVIGDGTYLENSTVQLIAVPYSGYVFQQWNDGNTDNPRDVTVTQDSTFTAYFALLDNEHYTLEDQGIYYIGGKIYNSQNLYIKLYYSDGRLISSGTNDIEMSNYPNGIYIVTDSKGGHLKVNHYK